MSPSAYGSFLTVSACCRLTGKVSFGSKLPVRKPIGEWQLLAHCRRPWRRLRMIALRASHFSDER
jgi:hypothetical protein